MFRIFYKSDYSSCFLWCTQRFGIRVLLNVFTARRVEHLKNTIWCPKQKWVLDLADFARTYFIVGGSCVFSIYFFLPITMPGAWSVLRYPTVQQPFAECARVGGVITWWRSIPSLRALSVRVPSVVVGRQKRTMITLKMYSRI